MLPLAHSPILRAKNPDEARAGIRVYHPGLRTFHSTGATDRPWRMSLNFFNLGSMQIAAAQFSACDSISDPDGSVRAFVPLRPGARLTFGSHVRSFTPQEVAIAPLAGGMRVDFGEGYRGFFIICRLSDLADSLHALDAVCDLPQAVDLLFRNPDVDWRPFRDQLRTTVSLLDSGPTALLDQAAFRQAHENLLRFHLASVVARAGGEPIRVQGHSRYTRRAVEYVEEHFGETIGIDTLATSAGCSVRTLQASMAADLGCSITGHIRTVRLAKARAMLIGAAAGSTVSGIAMDCGFSHLGEFAKAYGARFGERPSDTLATARLGPRRH